MEYQEILQNARTCMGPYCKACPVCNGQACKNTIPGPGAKGSGTGFARNYQKWQELRVNLDTIGENRRADTSFDFFGHRLALPVMAAPVGAMQLHYGDKYDDLTYNRLLLAACAKAGIVAFTGDGGRHAGHPGPAGLRRAYGEAMGSGDTDAEAGLGPDRRPHGHCHGHRCRRSAFPPQPDAACRQQDRGGAA